MIHVEVEVSLLGSRKMQGQLRLKASSAPTNISISIARPISDRSRIPRSHIVDSLLLPFPQFGELALNLV